MVGFVYLAGPLDGLHKIGFSDNPDRRLFQLFGRRCETVHKVEVWHRGVEYAFHRLFKDQRRDGEWFDLASADLALIGSVPDMRCPEDMPPFLADHFSDGGRSKGKGLLSVEVPTDLLERFRDDVRQRGVFMGFEVSRLIQNYLDEKGV